MEILYMEKEIKLVKESKRKSYLDNASTLGDMIKIAKECGNASLIDKLRNQLDELVDQYLKLFR